MGSSWLLLAHGAPDLGPEAFTPGAMAAGVVIRALEVLLNAAPYLLVGSLVAAVMRGMVGSAALRQTFGSGRGAVVRAALLGLVLPLCALGVLPVARELRRAGVPLGSTVTFVLSVTFNPLSLTYGLTLLEPLTLAVIVVAQFVISVNVGALLGRHKEVSSIQPEVVPATPTRRLVLTALAFTQSWLGVPTLCLFIGVLNAGFIAGVLPHGLLQSSMTRQNAWAPAAMTLISVPAYTTPLTGMMQAGTLLREGFSPGVAWVVLALAVSLNFGTVAWFTITYGRSAAFRLLLLLVTINLVVGYAAHFLVPSPVTPPDHTHCLDDYTRPPSASMGFAEASFTPLGEKFVSLDALPLAVLLASSLIGAAFQLAGVNVKPGEPVSNDDNHARKPFWNRPIPARWVAFIAIIGGVLIAVRLLYVFYPPPADLFEEMTALRTELTGPMRAQDCGANLDHVSRMQELARKLPVSALIRQGHLTPEQRTCADELMESLNTLRESIAAGRADEAIALLRYVKDTYDACRRAYPNTPNDLP